MITILKAMIKEEWRMHSSLVGNLMFSLFPAMILASSFLASLLYPILKEIFLPEPLIFGTHFILFMIGLSVGSFGLIGREIMNRRFGHASVIAYSIKNLPISERKIFVNFFIKDVIYYLLLWVFPICFGISIAIPFIGGALSLIPVLFLTLTLSFLFGLSIAFILSTLYAYSARLLLLGVALSALYLILSREDYGRLIFILPTYVFFDGRNIAYLASSSAITAVFLTISLIFIKVDFPNSRRNYPNSLVSISKLFKSSKFSYFISKDFIDMIRSEGGLGKIIFSYLLPSAFGWLIITIFLKLFPIVDSLLLFAIFLGIISSSVFGWLTDFDLYTSYSFLPIKVSDFIKSKLVSYSIINLLAPTLLLLAAYRLQRFQMLIFALVVMASISFYALSVTVYLTGLYTNIYLYNPKVFLLYLAMILPVTLFFMFISMVNPMFLLGSPLLFLLSSFIMKKAYEKWDRAEQQTF